MSRSSAAYTSSIIKNYAIFLNYYTHDEQAIEEVVQDVFVYLWKESDNLNITYLKTYLYSSARNRMLNYLRNETYADDHIGAMGSNGIGGKTSAGLH